jgi:hypothetical protein
MSKTPSSIPARLIGNGDKPIDQAEKQPAPLAFAREFAEQIGIQNGAFISVDGIAMKPTFEGECLILADLSDTILKDGKIYCLEIGAHRWVRRVQVLLDKIILMADNPDYTDMEISGEDLHRLNVIGRVRGVWRTFP